MHFLVLLENCTCIVRCCTYVGEHHGCCFYNMQLNKNNLIWFFNLFNVF